MTTKHDIKPFFNFVYDFTGCNLGQTDENGVAEQKKSSSSLGAPGYF
jgi:hypothetical protein